MSEFRDHLPSDATRERYAQAVTEAGRALAEARRERDELAMTGGPEAVARVAHVPGGPGEEEIAATYRRLQQESKGGSKDAA